MTLRKQSSRCLRLIAPTRIPQRNPVSIRVRNASTAASSLSNSYRVVAGIVLARNPIITRDPTPFEEEYYAYQQRLEDEAAAPFPTDFYFKKGSVAEKKWLEQEAERKQRLKTGKVANKAPESSQEEDTASGQQTEEIFTLAPRRSKADETNDMKALDRAMQRTLYLIVKKPREQHAWQFPQGGLEKDEHLHQAAFRELTEECGEDIDVWLVGRAPIGHYVYAYPPEHTKKHPQYKGSRVYFMKGHIFAGQVKPDQKEIVDFAWVTKEEMKEYVSKDYYEAVKDMLSDF